MRFIKRISVYTVFLLLQYKSFVYAYGLDYVMPCDSALEITADSRYSVGIKSNIHGFKAFLLHTVYPHPISVQFWAIDAGYLYAISNFKVGGTVGCSGSYSPELFDYWLRSILEFSYHRLHISGICSLDRGNDKFRIIPMARMGIDAIDQLGFFIESTSGWAGVSENNRCVSTGIYLHFGRTEGEISPSLRLPVSYGSYSVKLSLSYSLF